MGIQETKTEMLDDFMVRSIWGNPRFMFEWAPSRGNSGGIWIIWNPDLFCKSRVVIHQYYVLLEASWVLTGRPITFITVYAPQDAAEKRQLWSSLLQLVESCPGDCVLMGDFNEVRDESERLGTHLQTTPTRFFNQFIEEAGLVDVPMGGRVLLGLTNGDRSLVNLIDSW